jgi:hypothetical protein
MKELKMSDTTTLHPGVTPGTEQAQHIDPNTGTIVAPKVPLASEATPEPRAKSTFDLSAMTLGITWADGTSSSFDATKLPEPSKNFLLLRGMSYYLRGQAKPDEAFAELISGTVPTRREAGEAARKPNPWRSAIAHALVEMTKKADNPLTLEAASAKADSLDRTQINDLKADPVVVKHYARLTGKSASTSPLLSLV